MLSKLNTVVTLMPDNLCNILFEGFSDLSLNENRHIFELGFDFIKETRRLMLHGADVAAVVSIDAYLRLYWTG